MKHAPQPPQQSPACSGASGRRHELDRHQAAAAAAARALCSRAHPYPARGLLLWHSTGSGKTCTAAAAFDAAWGQARRKLVYVTSVVGLAANRPENFHECARMLPRWRARSSEQVGEAYRERGVEFLSFAQLAHILQLHRPRKAATPADADAMRHHVSDALLIVDEVHSLLTPLPGQRKECDALLEFLKRADDARTARLKVLLMTATPGDCVADVLSLLNVARSPGTRELEWGGDQSRAELARRVHGLVSFVDSRADRTRFPKVIEVQHSSRLSTPQAEQLARRTLGGRLRSPDPGAGRDAVRRVWQQPRRYTNTMFSWPKGAPVDEFSAKLGALLRTVERHRDGKHLVYSAFGERRGYGGHGARAIAKALRAHSGFEPHTGTAGMPPAERVAVLSRGEPVERIVRAFNEDANARGESLRVLIATHGYNEGINLLGLRHVHVFEPLVSAADDEQLVGRGVRMCSHAQLEYPAEWTLTVHRYTAAPPDVARDVERHDAEQREADAFSEALAGEAAVLKGVRGGTAVSERRAALRALARDARAAERARAAAGKRLALIGSAPHVDESVRALAARRAAPVEALLSVLRERAVDCSLLRDFHADLGIRCKKPAEA